MAKTVKQTVIQREPVVKKTSIGRSCNVSAAMMNKSKRRSYKKYRGQGR
jgi:hypothetical protein